MLNAILLLFPFIFSPPTALSKSRKRNVHTFLDIAVSSKQQVTGAYTLVFANFQFEKSYTFFRFSEI